MIDLWIEDATLSARLENVSVWSNRCLPSRPSRSRVVAGLDPAIHPFARRMDPRVKPHRR
jgi:hypothetical protein